MWSPELRRTLQRIERKTDAIMRAMALEYHHEREIEMGTRETLDRLQADVADMTDASLATKKALETYAASNAELTQELKDALATNADDEELKGIADKMEANDALLHEAAGLTAKAVTDNTPAAAPAAPTPTE